MQELKPVNSFEEKEKIEPKKFEPVVSNPVKVKKKSLWGKITDEFISEDGKGVGEYIIVDVLVPAIKKTISDIVTNGIDLLLYGTSTRRSSNNIPAYRVSYRNYYDQRNNDYARPRVSQTNYNYGEIIYETKGDAEAVLMRLLETLDEYQVAKVADYYDFSGKNCSYTDNKYGWTDLRYAEVVRVGDGYSIRLPKPMPID